MEVSSNQNAGGLPGDNQNAGGLPTDPLGRPKHGGARPGAGRPRKREVYAATVGEAEALIAKELPKLLAKYFELAAGVKVQGKSGRNGGEVVYERPPDGKVIADLLNRVMGKPVEHVEAENIGEEAETFVIVLPNNGRADTAPAHPDAPDAGYISRGTGQQARPCAATHGTLLAGRIARRSRTLDAGNLAGRKVCLSRGGAGVAGG